MAMSTAAACAPCVFEAIQWQTLSFPYQIATMTVSVIPQISVYPNLTRITNYDTVTRTDLLGPKPTNFAHTTYSDVNDITWNVGGAILTYPTTYIQYQGFEGAAATPQAGSPACANWDDVNIVSLPPTVPARSLIYPSGTMYVMPTPLLEYLNGIEDFTKQLGGNNLLDCAGFPYEPWETYYNCPVPTTQQQLPPMKNRRDATLQAGNSTAFWTNTTTYAPPTTLSTMPTPSPVQDSSSKSLQTTIPIGASTSFGTSATSTARSGNFNTSAPFGPTGQVIGTPPTSTASSSTSTCSPHHFTHHPGQHPNMPSRPVVNTYTSAFGITVVTGAPIITTINHPPPPNAPPSLREPFLSPAQEPEPVTSPAASRKGPKETNAGTPLTAPAPTRAPIASPVGVTRQPPGVVSQPNGGGSGKAPSSAPIFSFGNTQVTAGPSGITIGQHTVQPGKPVTIGSGASRTTVALQTSEGSTRLVVNGVTYNPKLQSTTAASPFAVITNSGHSLTAIQSGSSIVVEGGGSKTTIGPGSAVTFDGQTISVPQRGSSIVVNGTTKSLSKPAPAPLTTETEAAITTDGHTFTAVDKSGSIILEGASTTEVVKPGSVVTFEGQTISAGTRGTDVVVNGYTIKVTPTTAQIERPFPTGPTSGSSRTRLWSFPMFATLWAYFVLFGIL